MVLADGFEPPLLFTVPLYKRLPSPLGHASTMKWCPRRDSNPHAEALVPKTSVSSSSTTGANWRMGRGSNSQALAGRQFSGLLPSPAIGLPIRDFWSRTPDSNRLGEVEGLVSHHISRAGDFFVAERRGVEPRHRSLDGHRLASEPVAVPATLRTFQRTKRAAREGCPGLNSM